MKLDAQGRRLSAPSMHPKSFIGGVPRSDTCKERVVRPSLLRTTHFSCATTYKARDERLRDCAVRKIGSSIQHFLMGFGVFTVTKIIDCATLRHRRPNYLCSCTRVLAYSARVLVRVLVCSRVVVCAGVPVRSCTYVLVYSCIRVVPVLVYSCTCVPPHCTWYSFCIPVPIYPWTRVLPAYMRSRVLVHSRTCVLV